LMKKSMYRYSQKFYNNFSELHSILITRIRMKIKNEHGEAADKSARAKSRVEISLSRDYFMQPQDVIRRRCRDIMRNKFADRPAYNSRDLPGV